MDDIQKSSWRSEQYTQRLCDFIFLPCTRSCSLQNLSQRCRWKGKGIFSSLLEALRDKHSSRKREERDSTETLSWPCVRRREPSHCTSSGHRCQAKEGGKKTKQGLDFLVSLVPLLRCPPKGTLSPLPGLLSLQPLFTQKEGFPLSL